MERGPRWPARPSDLRKKVMTARSESPKFIAEIATITASTRITAGIVPARERGRWSTAHLVSILVALITVHIILLLRKSLPTAARSTA